MPENWNEIVKYYRLRHGLSQAEMAKIMDVSQRTISRWERGEDSPAIQYKKKLRDLSHEPPEVFLRSLVAAVKNCPVPRALTRTQNLQLIAASRPAVLKRPSIVNWYGKNLIDIASGVLQEMLDDRDLQKAISSREVTGVTTVCRSVLDTPESPNIATYRTTISYFYHEGTLYSDAISTIAEPDARLGYWPFSSEDGDTPAMEEPPHLAAQSG